MLKVGDLAPFFQGINQDFKNISLSDFAGKKLILYFYPKDSTPGCTAEACDLRDNHNMWLSKNYSIIGISPDTPESHKKFKQKHDLPFDLISDSNKEILRLYNAWGTNKIFGISYEGVLRKTFVINEQQIIEQIIDKVNTKKHTEQILLTISNND